MQKHAREILKADGTQGPGTVRKFRIWGCLPSFRLSGRTVTVSLWFITMPSDLAKKKAAKRRKLPSPTAAQRTWRNGDAITEPQVAEERNEEANGRETLSE